MNEAIPLNKKILLRKYFLNLEEKDKPKFIWNGDTPQEIEYFQVIRSSKDCTIYIDNDEIVTVDFYTPIGKIGEEELFVCAETSITAKILLDNTIRTKK